MLALVTALSLLLTSIYLVHVWLKRKYSFWKDRDVLTPPVQFGWGNYRESILQEKSFGEALHEFYRFFKSHGVPHGGLYTFTSPVYMPVDITIVKAILQNDFDHFVDRGFYVNQRDDPLSANLFTLEEQKWRPLRSKFTPAFSTAKLKMMYETLFKCTGDLEEALEEFEGKHLDIKELIGRFTINVIGSCAFGVECNCLKEPNNEFRLNGSSFFERTTFENFKIFLADVAPGLMKKLHVSVSRPSTIEFFKRLTQETMEYRERNNVIRKDFMHLLIQLKNSGILVDTEDVGDIEKRESGEKVSLEDLVGQAYVFFIAGYETPSNTISYTLYFLAVFKEMQEKCRKEVEDCLARHGGQLSYEAVSEMHYVDSVINESMRFYPPVHVLNRVCTKDYQVPGTDLLLKKGQKVVIPVLGIQRDEEHYPNPDTFDPDRFSAENSKWRNPATFLPFGYGPKNCIGLRFGMVQVKTAVITVIRHYEISLNERTKYPMEFDTGHPLTLCPKGGIWLNMKKIGK
ncbi:cytochrome P450 6k1-like [Coccinella septempunctata]|uniref:cytochrome P450 6k1-like n=1 Tax=Coccinella septempunctata TaxID=41139 RepID=UPI001D07F0A4|nr:cytochrome P450 6k1-like [Coccinella septempunctata]XP_044761020.1 cytochrome P450 6k1-like [Coccinella septempunctata]